MKIGIAFDLVPAPACTVGEGPDDRYEEFDKPETVEAIAAVLRQEGHEVTLLGDGPALLRALLDDPEPPEFVWNLAEGQGVGRSREARVPAALEMLGIPYSGSDPLTLAVALDKPVAKQLVAAAGVRVPEGLVFGSEHDRDDVARQCQALFSRLGRARACGAGLAGMGGFGFGSRDGVVNGSDLPIVILKPAFEGSSKGIRGACLAHEPNVAVATFERLAHDYGQPVVVEEFVPGEEVTVGIVGNGPYAQVLGALRVVPRQPTDEFVYSLEVKRDWQRQVDYEVPARLDPATLERLAGDAMRVYQALGCRDVARIDFRVRGDEPFFIEANPLPGLAPVTSDLVILARGMGLEHADLIRRILHEALARNGLMHAAELSAPATASA